uniref:Uncharacterized protein n=1 Tax=Nelumbo nucifera TaxID=4432 RepID=A0A822YK04_NELNU|nr:TPA_asm: hypothetical protein HUJ06_005164 [Nelumbo nucifera]
MILLSLEIISLFFSTILWRLFLFQFC